MRRRFSCRRDRNGLMALEALLAILLSVAALVSLLFIFINIFLGGQPTNLEIAKDNARSIADFIDYYSIKSSSYYSDMTNCFGILKLFNLENFQIKEKSDGENYFYVITTDSVYILKLEDYPKFVEGKSPSKFSVDRVTFYKGSQVSLRKDATDEGSLFSVDIDITGTGFFGTRFGDYGSLSIKELDEDLIVLIPDFNNQNHLLSGVFEDRGLEMQRTGYLVLSKEGIDEGNTLFVNKNSVSEMLIKNNLCSRKIFSERRLSEFYSDPSNFENIDYFNNELFFSCSSDSQDSEYFELRWMNSGICTSSESKYCNEFRGDNKDYRSFVRAGINLCEEQEGKFKLKERRDLGLNEYSSSSVPFESVFEVLENVDVSSMSSEDKKTHFVYSFNFHGINCNGYSYCKEIYVKDKSTYFYVGREGDRNPRFYKFDEKALRRKRNSHLEDFKYHFLGKRVEVDSKEIDRNGLAFSRCEGTLECIGAILGGGNDNANFYRVRISEGINGLSRPVDVYLTPLQFNSIPIMKEEN